MRNEGDMAGGEVKEQMRKKRQGKKKQKKRKYNGMETAIMKFLDHFEGNFKNHILVRTNKKLHKIRRWGWQVLLNFVVCLQMYTTSYRKSEIVKGFSLFYTSYKIFLSN